MTIKTIDAHIPGILYLKPSPNEPAFKSDGDAVAEGDTVALIEVMKSFMPVEATVAGKLVRFLVESEQPVDAGQAICEIETDN